MSRLRRVRLKLSLNTYVHFQKRQLQGRMGFLEKQHECVTKGIFTRKIDLIPHMCIVTVILTTYNQSSIIAHRKR